MAAAILATLLAGCGGGGGEAQAPSGVEKEASLVAFAGPSACTDLEAYVEDTAVAPAARAEAAAPSAYTSTNNQVAGVDEADFVKNDGTRIFVLSGDRLHAARSWPPEQLHVAGSIAIEGWPQQMFLDGPDRVVVFSSVSTAPVAPPGEPVPIADSLWCDSPSCGYAPAMVKVSLVDVSDLAAPRLVREVYLPGSYRAARMNGRSVRLVLTDSFAYPAIVRWGPAWDPAVWSDPGKLRAAYDALIADNEKAIRDRTLDDWLPQARSVVAGRSTALPHDCSTFSRVNAPTRMGTLTVATLDLSQPDGFSRASIMGEADEVYASASNLYVATRQWWSWPEPGQTDRTHLHKFDISRPERATYVASGSVEGHLADQFSIDEAATGHLRVATTVEVRVPDPANPWGRIETSSRVLVLAQDGARLAVVGRTEALAPGERIQSARFVGTRGYVVTFRQVDPLFAFDLSDPRAPRMVGELEVPGFSTYLHPIDERHLLAIGTFVPEPPAGQPVDWQARAVQLAIFDVGDAAKPLQLHTQLVGTSYGSSEAQSDHKAFNWFPAKKLLAIPFADWSPSASGAAWWASFVSELRVFRVDPAAGFTPLGALSMGDLYRTQQDRSWSWQWSPQVRRSVIADDYAYAISDAGIRVARTDRLAEPLATAPFTR
jgi:uncharacterized secreted protein with C-terminal beta-propeller domain